MRKLLYLKWDCFGEEYICRSFQKAGFDIEQYPIPYGEASLRHNENFERELATHLLSSSYEFVFSFNYFPAVALAVHKVGGKYVSWTYDSPFMFLYSTTIMLPCNIAFCFDKATVDNLQSRGVTTLHYLPMAAPVDLYDKIICSSKQRKDYQAELSFVGSMYTEARQSLMKNLNGISEEVRNYLETIMNMQLNSYAMPILEKLLIPQVINELQAVCPLPLEKDEMQTEAWMYANYFLARETTARERTQIIGEYENFSVNS